MRVLKRTKCIKNDKRWSTCNCMKTTSISITFTCKGVSSTFRTKNISTTKVMMKNAKQTIRPLRMKLSRKLRTMQWCRELIKPQLLELELASEAWCPLLLPWPTLPQSPMERVLMDLGPGDLSDNEVSSSSKKKRRPHPRLITDSVQTKKENL